MWSVEKSPALDKVLQGDAGLVDTSAYRDSYDGPRRTLSGGLHNRPTSSGLATTFFDCLSVLRLMTGADAISTPVPMNRIGQNEAALTMSPPANPATQNEDSGDAAEPAISCNGCRKRKLKCSREAPACQNCRKIGMPSSTFCQFHSLFLKMLVGLMFEICLS